MNSRTYQSLAASLLIGAVAWGAISFTSLGATARAPWPELVGNKDLGQPSDPGVVRTLERLEREYRDGVSARKLAGEYQELLLSGWSGRVVGGITAADIANNDLESVLRTMRTCSKQKDNAAACVFICNELVKRKIGDSVFQKAVNEIRIKADELAPPR